MKVLVTEQVNADVIERLRKNGHEVIEQSYSPEELGPALREFDAVIIRYVTEIRKAQIDALRGGRLKLIVRSGVGLDNIDVEYAKAAGLQIRNTPTTSTNAVAELALGLLLSCARYISVLGYELRERRWDSKPFFDGFELSGKTIGILGYGHIGQSLGAKCQALGMNVLSVVHRHKPEGVECATMRFVSMEELLASSDVVCLCAPTGDRPLVDRDVICQMKDGVVIINVSRGANLDEAALLDALRSGKVRAAGLDVWVSEKNPNWELATHPAVSCTPHIGAGTREAKNATGDQLVEIINTFQI